MSTLTSTDARMLRGRVVPALLWGGRAQQVLERNLLVFRRRYLVIVSGFFEPLFYLLAIGVGIGALVGDVTLSDGRVIDYTAFVAPGMLASSAMNGAVYETTMNVFFKLKYAKTYDAMVATPITPADVARGELAFALVRGGLYAVAFCVVMLAMGLFLSPWGVLAVPAALLIGFAFGGVGLASTSFMRSWQDFELVTLATLPLFLFSATFYPLDTYPPGIRWLVAWTPLSQGVVLLRSLTTGDVGWGLLVPVAYLAAMGSVGLRVATRRFARLLLS